MSLQEKKHRKPDEIADPEIDYSDIPETDREFWIRAKVVMPKPKKAISLRIDRDVLEWFKAQGKGYQSRMNVVLKSYVDAHTEKR